MFLIEQLQFMPCHKRGFQYWQLKFIIWIHEDGKHHGLLCSCTNQIVHSVMSNGRRWVLIAWVCSMTSRFLCWYWREYAGLFIYLDHMKKTLLPLTILQTYSNFFKILFSPLQFFFWWTISHVSFLQCNLFCHWPNSLKRSDRNKGSPFLGFKNILIVFKLFYYAPIFKNNICDKGLNPLIPQPWVFIQSLWKVPVVLWLKYSTAISK